MYQHAKRRGAPDEAGIIAGFGKYLNFFLSPLQKNASPPRAGTHFPWIKNLLAKTLSTVAIWGICAFGAGIVQKPPIDTTALVMETASLMTAAFEHSLEWLKVLIAIGVVAERLLKLIDLYRRLIKKSSISRQAKRRTASASRRHKNPNASQATRRGRVPKSATRAAPRKKRT
ncbi:MAG: hypothetical protein LBK60_00295 [Verrucomicrobiales bacterium]|jgi:hypothetical protein|nr:hypothetical protein [Verrucomicrobiales bacterium]